MSVNCKFSISIFFKLSLHTVRVVGKDQIDYEGNDIPRLRGRIYDGNNGRHNDCSMD